LKGQKRARPTHPMSVYGFREHVRIVHLIFEKHISHVGFEEIRRTAWSRARYTVATLASQDILVTDSGFSKFSNCKYIILWLEKISSHHAARKKRV
jgi:hypothetical protein